MNKLDLIKRLLPGFLPIIVFIIVDEFWGTWYGLVVAIGIGVMELGIGLVRKRQVDRFVIFDVGLLLALGGVSLLLDNDIFFRLKPGVISLLMTGMIGFSAFSRHNILLQMSQRYMKGVEMNPYQMWMMQQTMKRIFWLLLGYSLLSILSAFIGPKSVWGFLNGPGLFVVMGLYMVLEWWQKKSQNQQFQQEEWVPLVDENGQAIGTAPRSVVHNGSKLLHPVVHLHVFSEDGILLQKRPLHKQIQPGKWDTAVGGHVDVGESIEKALQRETSEEIGVQEFNAQFVKQYVWESAVERELVFVFKTNLKGPFCKADDEVEELRFWSMPEIEANLGKNLFTPNFECEFRNDFRVR